MNNTIGNIDHYVYIYLDPRKPGKYIYDNFILEAEPFYVGSGRGYRKRYHLYENDTNHKNKPKYYKIRKLKTLGLQPIILELYSNLTKEDSLILETEVIKKIGLRFKKSGPLLNFKTAENDNIYIKVLRGRDNPMFGRTIFDVWREKYDEDTVTKMIEAYKINMSNSTSGPKNGMYGVSRFGEINPNFGNGKTVSQFSRNGIFIRDWVNVPDAARNIHTKKPKSEKAIIANIYRSIQSGNSAWGSYWKYKE